MNPDHSKVHDAGERFARYLRETGRRNTPERQLVLSRALAARRFFSVEELGEAINAEGSHLAQATLYATLELLCEAGLLGRKHTARRTLYCPVAAGSAQTVCSVCGKVTALKVPELSAALGRLQPGRFVPSGFYLEIQGMCSICARRQKKKSQNNI